FRRANSARAATASPWESRRPRLLSRTSAAFRTASFCSAESRRVVILYACMHTFVYTVSEGARLEPGSPARSHDLFDRELVAALRALRDPLPAFRRPVTGRAWRLRGLDERLRPRRIQGQGLQPDEVVQLLHDLRRQDRLEFGEELGLGRPEAPEARDEQQDALAEQSAGAA